LFIFFSPLGGDKYIFEQEGIVELYHIEQCIDPNCSSIDNSLDDNIIIHTNLKMSLEENIELNEKMPGVSVSMVKKDKTRRNEGNPGIKPPNRQTNDHENDISLSKFENNKIQTRPKTRETKSGIKITRLRSKRPVMTYQPSMNDPCSSIIANTIYLNTKK
jgi:hypothetical protein